MAATEWVIVNRKWCERAGADVVLMEQRVYPSEIIPNISGHRVMARKCSCAMECNLAEIPCKWSFTRPVYDPFNIA